MMWQEKRVQRYAIGTLVIGVVGAVLLGVSFGTTSWLVFPPGHFYMPNHRLNMGLFRDIACIGDECGTVPPTQIRRDMQNEWDCVLALMCTTLAISLMALAMNTIIIVMPRKTFSICASVFWLSAGVMNLISVVIFGNHFNLYHERMSWSYWVSMISTIIFCIVGVTLCFFTCCHRWTKIKAVGHNPVAPPPVNTHGFPSGSSTSWDNDTYSVGAGMAHNSQQTGHGSSQSYQI